MYWAANCRMRWEEDCDGLIDAKAIGARWALNDESLVLFSRSMRVFASESLKRASEAFLLALS